MTKSLSTQTIDRTGFGSVIRRATQKVTTFIAPSGVGSTVPYRNFTR